MHFEATEENKLIYMDLFKKYQEMIEQFLLKELSESVENFSMEEFMTQLSQRKDEIDEPLMDLMLSLSEFESFKELMLFSRAHLVATTPKMKSGKAAMLGLSDKPPGQQPTNLELGNKMGVANLKHFESSIDGLCVSGKSTKVYIDEQEDGEERPDLNLEILKL